MRAGWLLPVALLAATAAEPQITPAPQQPNVAGYVARVEPHFATKSVTGNVRIRIVASSTSTTAYAFDAGDLVIDAVRESGAAVPFEKRVRQLVVRLPRASETVEREIEIDYHGTPRRGLSFAADVVSAAFATSDWLPCVDAPS